MKQIYHIFFSKLFCIGALFFILNTPIYAQKEKVYDYLDKELATKPSPTDEFVTWLKENNKKLGKAAKYNTKETTKVTLVFVVDEQGKLSSVFVWRGIGQGYDAAAVYLVRGNPYLWNSGQTSDGIAVKTKVYYQLDYMKNDNHIMTVNNTPIK